MSQLPPLDKNQLPPLPDNFPQIPQLPKNSSFDEFGKKIARQKKIIGFGVLLFGLGFLGMFIYQLGIVPKLAPQNKTVIINGNADQLLAEVRGQKIYKSDVEKLAREQYQADAITDEILKRFLNKAIERAILDYEANKLGLEIDASISTGSAFLATETDYQSLRDEITKQAIESRAVFTLGFAIPPDSYPMDDDEKAVYQKQKAVSLRALNEIERRLKNGESPFSIAEIVSKNYPDLRSILGLNGYIFEDAKDDERLNLPKLYTYSDEKMKQDQYQAIFGLTTPNEVAKVLFTENGGGLVIKLVKANTSTIKNYDEWLKQKRKELVKII